MSKLLDDLINYFETTPKEQLEKDFKELEPWTKVGPTVDEYIKMMKEAKKQDILIVDYLDLLNNQVDMDPEYSRLVDEHFDELI